MALVPPRSLELHLHLQQQQRLGAVAAAALLRRRNHKRERRRRQYWRRPCIERLVIYGDYENLMRELERESQGDFTNFMRMEPRTFQELLLRVRPRLTKQDTNYRKALEPSLKLAITLRYMTSGNRT